MRSSAKATRALLIGAAVFVSIAAAAPAPSSDAPLADAAMRRDTAKVRLLLKQGADANAAQGDGMTALHWAATHGDTEEAKMLIFAGARLDAVTRNGNYTPLHVASRSGNTNVVKALLEAGANAKAVTTSGGTTALHFAAAHGSAETVNALLDRAAVVDARETAWGQTPLMWAAAYNRVAALEALIKRGADVKAVSKVDDIPARERVDRAALQLRARRVAALKAAEQAPAAGGRGGRGGAAGEQNPSSGRGGERIGEERTGGGRGERQAATPATMAPKRDSLGLPPLDTTAKSRARTLADSTTRRVPADSQRIINANAGGLSYSDLIGNKGGLTALLFAVREGHVESVLALLKAGADVNQVSAGDHTSPLLMATINGHFDLAKTLLERGANVKLASDAGATPLYATINLQWAAKSLYPQPTAHLQQKTSYLELMEAFLKAGADPNARLKKHLWYMSYNFDLLGVNTTGATPFWRAAYGTDVAAMRLLVKHGADPSIPTLKPAGRQQGADAPAEEDTSKADPSGLPPIAAGGPGVYPIHAASGVGYGEGYAANSHIHAPDGWLPSVKYLVEELHADVNSRDFNGYNPVHHAAARGDNQLIEYLVSKGADVKAISRRGQTTADMANGPVQRIPPFLETIALLEKLGSKNSHKCKSC